MSEISKMEKLAVAFATRFDPHKANDFIDGWLACESENKERTDFMLRYCAKYIDQMWAATFAGIILGCEYRDAADRLKELGYMGAK